MTACSATNVKALVARAAYKGIRGASAWTIIVEATKPAILGFANAARRCSYWNIIRAF